MFWRKKKLSTESAEATEITPKKTEYVFEASSTKTLEPNTYYVFSNRYDHYIFRYKNISQLVELRGYWVLCLDGEPVSWKIRDSVLGAGISESLRSL